MSLMQNTLGCFGDFKMASEAKEWDNYWTSKTKNRLFKIFRTQIFARAVKYYTDKYFSKEGTFVEAGCGSGQTSIRINKYKRKLIALDISQKALDRAKENKKFDEYILGDITKLPFKDSSIDGLWNLGVMEHFTDEELPDVINEIYRVLKPNGTAIIFWATEITHYKVCLNTYNKFFKKNIQLFPNEPTRLTSKKHASSVMSRTKFKNCKIFYSWRDLFT